MEKVKKERTEAQKNATLAMLKARREKKNTLVKKNDNSSEDESEDEPLQKIKKERKPKKKVVVNSVSIDIPPPLPAPTPKIVEHVTKDDLQALRNDIAGMLRPAPPVVTEKNVVKKVKIPKKEVVIEVSEEEEEDVAPIKKKDQKDKKDKKDKGQDLLV